MNIDDFVNELWKYMCDILAINKSHSLCSDKVKESGVSSRITVYPLHSITVYLHTCRVAICFGK